MISRQFQKLLDICVALSSERDREELLSRILDTAIDLANSDGGTLYLLENNELHFCRMVTKSFSIRQGGHAAPITLPPVPLRHTHVCARAVLERRLINVPDVHSNDEFDFTGARKYDAMTGYHTRSMLVVPLANDRGDLIGVLQLINALTESGEATDFTSDVESVMLALASQAAISLTNMFYAEQITQLLDSLVGALSTAIDARTPYNANHTRNMVKYGTRFLDWLEQSGNSWQFDPDTRRSFLLSVWLHDVGKLVVPLEVMDKASRLSSHLERVENRFSTMALLTKISLLQGEFDQDEYERRIAEQEDTLNFIRQINSAGFLPDDRLARVDEIAKRTYIDQTGEIRSWITEEEHKLLSIRKGTLSAEERTIMESHVEVTARILEQVSFPKQYWQVPGWASSHHELLNGKGYPKHITAESIPPEVRLLTVLDIFDALTAFDRPYKPGMPTEKALSILQNMVQEGNLDEKIVNLFIESKAWEEAK